MSEFTYEIVPLPKQFEALQFLRAETDDALKIIGFFGGWGSAKTTGAAFCFLVGCAEAPWTPAYGNQQHPKSAIVAPNLRTLRQSTLVPLEGVMPPEIILRRRGQPFNDILLRNGHMIELHSAESLPEGQSYVNVWADEIHHTNFTLRKYLNIQARARDPLARRLSVIVSGLPETGWLRDTFDRPDTARRKTMLLATRDNPHIKPEVIAEFLASCPSGQEQALLGGAWMSAMGAIYPQFDPRVHVVDREFDPRIPVDVSFDVGNFSCVLFAQHITVPIRNVVGQITHGDGLLICGQMLPDNLSVDRICYEIKTRTQFLIIKGGSTICVDPTTDRDELAAIRKHFPGVRIVRRERGDTTFPVKTGIRYVQRALMDALGNVRLFFSRSIAGAERGIVAAMPRYRWGENGEPVKDNLHDHAQDSLRYVVAEMLPAERRLPTVRDE